MSHAAEGDPGVFDETYWAAIAAGDVDSSREEVGESDPPEVEDGDANQFCMTCPFNENRTEGPVQPIVGAGSCMQGEYVDIAWRDREGNQTREARVYYKTADGGIGSDEVYYTEQWTSERMQECSAPLPSSERSLATLGLRKTVPRCRIFYEKNESGKATREKGVYFK